MLKAINVGYDAAEDRLVLRLLSDSDPGEQVLHLTRRTCATWRGDLQALVDHSAQPPDTMSQQARVAVSTAHHQAMAAQASIRRQSAEQSRPQAAPQLVAGVRCGRRREDGRWVISFMTVAKRELSLQLSSESLHGLVQIVNQQITVAEWQLPSLPFDQAAAQAPAATNAGLH